MTKYLISFPSAATVYPDEDLQAVSDASHAELQEDHVWIDGVERPLMRTAYKTDTTRLQAS